MTTNRTPENQRQQVANDDTLDPTVGFANHQFLYLKSSSCLAPLDNVWWQQFLSNRIKSLDLLKESGVNPYPHKFDISMSITEYIDKYRSLHVGEHVENTEISLAGTLHKNWFYFYDCLLGVYSDQDNIFFKGEF